MTYYVLVAENEWDGSLDFVAAVFTDVDEARAALPRLENEIKNNRNAEIIELGDDEMIIDRFEQKWATP